MSLSDIWAFMNENKMREEYFAHEFYRTIVKTKYGDITIDSCFVADMKYYETGIERDGNWYIVETNIPEAELAAVHQKWVSLITKEPDMELVDKHEGW